MIPVAFVLFTLHALRTNEFYPKLPVTLNYVIAAAYCCFALYTAYYMHANYMSLGLERSGMWDTQDLVVGGVMTLLIIEYARKRHVPLFILTHRARALRRVRLLRARHVLSCGLVAGSA